MDNNEQYKEECVKFVASHYKSNAFDTQKAWEKMQKHMTPPAKTRKLKFLYPAVAAIAAIAVISIVFFSLEKQNTLTAKADHTDFSLPDSTHINMRKGAKLVYATDYGKKARKVNMRGEITFDVARDENKPFIVSTPTAQVKVLGTSFTVSEDEKGTRLNVTSGVVEFTPQDPIIPILCTAGTSVHYTAKKELVEITSPTSSMVINGAENTLSFTNAPLKDVTLILSHYFNAEIQIPEEETQLLFSSSFTNKSIIEILNIINLTLESHLSMKK